MLTPDAKLLRTLLARYASARIADAERSTPASRRELADVTYTLCVTTATRTTEDAIAAAEAVLSEERAAA
ncbi:DUF5133 domain-containing protein [Streptomyces sp. M19]